jgi:hypothetical protein
MFMLVPVLEETLGIESLSHKETLESIDDFFGYVSLRLSGIYSSIVKLDLRVFNHHVNLLL